MREEELDLRCALLYSIVALFAVSKTGLVDSYIWHGFGFASLTVNTLESVPSSLGLV